MFAAYASGDARKADGEEEEPAENANKPFSLAQAETASSFPQRQQDSDSDDGGSPEAKRAKKKKKKEKKKKREIAEKTPSSLPLQRAPSSALQVAAEAALQAAASRGEGVSWGINVRADVDNLRYGRPYAKDVPSFRRLWRRKALGIVGSVDLEPEPGRGPVSASKSASDPRSASGTKGTSKGKFGGRPAALSAADRYFNWHVKGSKKLIYIPTPRPEPAASKKRSARWDSLQATTDASDLELFVPLSADVGDSGAIDARGVPPATPAGTSQSLLDSATSEEGKTEEERARARNVEYARRLERKPRDSAIWREYIAFQDESMPLEVGRSPKLPSLLSQRKQELYERALQHLPHDEELLRGYLQQCDTMLTPDEMEAKWQQVMRNNAGSASLWREFLAYASSTLARFRVPQVQAKYHSCLETLDNLRQRGKMALAGLAPPYNTLAAVEAALLDVFTASCEFQAQAGFQERALGCYQAQLEANLRLPGEFRGVSSLRGQPSRYLEAFWEAAVPRYGEPGAPGFAYWLQFKRAGRPLPDPAPEVRTAMEAALAPPPDHPPQLTGVTEWQRWLEVERYRERRHWQSWRPAPGSDEDEEACDDPDRICLFDDVAGHIFRLSSEVSKAELVLRAAEFLGASLPVRVSSAHQRTAAAALRLTGSRHLFAPLVGCMAALARGLRRSVEDWERRAPGFLPVVAGGLGDVVDRADPFRPGRARVSGMTVGDLPEVWGGLLPPLEPEGTAELHDGHPAIETGDLALILEEAPRGWFPTQWEEEDLQPAGRGALALQLLEQAQADLSQASAAAIAMARIDILESFSIKRAKKAMKALLKQPAYRNNLRFYVRYARLEAAAGKPADAHKVYTTALQLAAQQTDDAKGSTSVLPDGAAEACWAFAAWHMQRGTPASQAHALKAAVALLLHGGGVGAALHLGSLSPAIDATAEGLPATALVRVRHALDTAAATWPRWEAPATTAAVADALALASCQLLATLLLRGLDALETLADVVLAALTLPLKTGDAAGSSLEVLDELDLAREKLYTRVLRLLLWQARGQRMPPALVRARLLQALDAYPNNPEFLTCLLVSEGRLHIAGRVQRHFADHLKRCNSPISWLFAIAGEILRPPSAASPHRVRRLFQRAVETRACRCPLVWRMYMEFERAQSGLEGLAIARGIFYRALQSCPGAKVLYLDAARHTPRQLQEVLDILQEKELHLRSPLEELELIEAEVEAAAVAGTT